MLYGMAPFSVSAAAAFVALVSALIFNASKTLVARLRRLVSISDGMPHGLVLQISSCTHLVRTSLVNLIHRCGRRIPFVSHVSNPDCRHGHDGRPLCRAT